MHATAGSSNATASGFRRHTALHAASLAPPSPTATAATVGVVPDEFAKEASKNAAEISATDIYLSVPTDICPVGSRARSSPKVFVPPTYQVSISAPVRRGTYSRFTNSTEQYTYETGTEHEIFRCIKIFRSSDLRSYDLRS